MSVFIVEPEDTWHAIAGSREMAEGVPPRVRQGMLWWTLNVRPQENILTLSDSLRTKAAYTAGSVGNHNLDVLLDSGASRCDLQGLYTTWHLLHGVIQIGQYLGLPCHSGFLQQCYLTMCS